MQMSKLDDCVERNGDIADVLTGGHAGYSNSCAKFVPHIV